MSQVIVHLVAARNALGHPQIDERLTVPGLTDPSPCAVRNETVSEMSGAVAPGFNQAPFCRGTGADQLRMCRQQHINTDVLPVGSCHSRCPVSSVVDVPGPGGPWRSGGCH